MNSQHNVLPRLLTVCADDFGLSPDVSAGIAQLARSRRISAVSCLTNTPDWKQSAPALSDLPTSVAIGLHINLTEGQPLSPELAALWPTLPSLSSLMARAHLGLLPQAAVQCEIEAQWGAFVAHMGQRPQFVDGHQHVHQFPGVRTAMLRTLDQLQARPAVRSAARVIGPGHGFKRWVIRQSGARDLLSKLRERNLSTNSALLGVYDFQATDYRSLVQAWLAALPEPGGLLFCHPGLGGEPSARDTLDAARQREFDYLSGEHFMKDLASANIALVRAWQ